jgi:hypothetical protein
MLRAGAMSAVAVLVIALAGCGSSTSASTSTQSSSSATSGAKTSASSGVLRTEPAPLPAGTPSAPAGLARTGGYDTYELCRGDCTGHIPASLRRPLHLPHSTGSDCPVSATSTPVSISGGSRLAAQRFVGSRWLAAHVTWRAAVGYHGPILIRGRRMDGGGGAVGFGEGHTPYDELQLLNSGRGEATSGGGRAWLSLTRVQHPGCYAYQIDGTSFSHVIVFRVRS